MAELPYTFAEYREVATGLVLLWLAWRFGRAVATFDAESLEHHTRWVIACILTLVCGVVLVFTPAMRHDLARHQRDRDACTEAGGVMLAGDHNRAVCVGGLTVIDVEERR